LIGVLLLLLAAGLLVAGAELFVDNAAAAAGRLGVTVLAVGILLAGAEPETMLTVTLGLAALLRPVPVGHRVRVYAVLSSVAGAFALLTVLGGHVSRQEGALLVLAYAALVAVVWWRERQPPALGELAELEAADDDGRGTGVALLLAVVGIAVMAAGGKAAVDGATRVVQSLGQSDTAIGLTVLALATTAELFALVLAAARRDLAEVAVAGVVGSAAYNATATLGVAALVHPLETGSVTAPAVAAAVLPLAVLVLARGGVLRRPAGTLLVAAYVVFLVLVLR
jgi:cation:H+ antiporter